MGIVLGIEAICAAQALDMHSPLKGGLGVEAARIAVRGKIRHLHRDRQLDGDIAAAAELVADPSFQLAAEAAAGPIG